MTTLPRVLPPEIIETIVLQIIFSSNPFRIRHQAFNAITLLSRQWYLVARRLQLVRLDIPDVPRLQQLISYLKFQQALEPPDANYHRVPPQILEVVGLGKPPRPTSFEQLSELFQLIDLSQLKELKIEFAYESRTFRADFQLLPHITNGDPIFPQLETLTFRYLSDIQLSRILKACDNKCLKNLSIHTKRRQNVEKELSAAGVTFPNLQSLTINHFYEEDWGIFFGAHGVEALMPNVESVIITIPGEVEYWPQLIERLKNFRPQRLKYLKIAIRLGESNGEWDVRATAIPLARYLGCTLAISLWNDFKPAASYVFTPDSDV